MAALGVIVAVLFAVGIKMAARRSEIGRGALPDAMNVKRMSFLGMTPFGSLIVGSAATHIGVPVTLTIGGTVCILGALVFAMRLPALRAHVRPVYVDKGILPESVPVAR